MLIQCIALSIDSLVQKYNTRKLLSQQQLLIGKRQNSTGTLLHHDISTLVEVGWSFFIVGHIVGLCTQA